MGSKISLSLKGMEKPYTPEVQKWLTTCEERLEKYIGTEEYWEEFYKTLNRTLEISCEQERFGRCE